MVNTEDPLRPSKSGDATAPKATPTANPSGILWIAIARTKRTVFLRSVFGPSASSTFAKRWRWGINLSIKYKNNAPAKKPIAGGNHTGVALNPSSFCN